MSILLNGYIDVPADRLDAVQTALIDHIRLTRAEAGCISFNVSPAANHKGRFEVNEEFVDRAAFEFHQQRTAASQWADISKGIARHYTVEQTPEPK
ncbi:MAG TPA: antibiotic biosynthesis monooxygenase [Rhodobacteraceae bacterium]|nr:antibiotic biosynthesis monooxygenase [Paracoccaceae bacterium]